MSDALVVRVRVLDAWDDIALHLAPETRIEELKRQALDAAHVAEAPAHFMVKFRGARVIDESQSLADTHVPSGAAMIVMRSHRVAVR